MRNQGIEYTIGNAVVTEGGRRWIDHTTIAYVSPQPRRGDHEDYHSHQEGQGLQVQSESRPIHHLLEPESQQEVHKVERGVAYRAQQAAGPQHHPLETP